MTGLREDPQITVNCMTGESPLSPPSQSHRLEVVHFIHCMRWIIPCRRWKETLVRCIIQQTGPFRCQNGSKKRNVFGKKEKQAFRCVHQWTPPSKSPAQHFGRSKLQFDCQSASIDRELSPSSICSKPKSPRMPFHATTWYSKSRRCKAAKREQQSSQLSCDTIHLACREATECPDSRHRNSAPGQTPPNLSNWDHLLEFRQCRATRSNLAHQLAHCSVWRFRVLRY